MKIKNGHELIHELTHNLYACRLCGARYTSQYLMVNNIPACIATVTSAPAPAPVTAASSAQQSLNALFKSIKWPTPVDDHAQHLQDHIDTFLSAPAAPAPAWRHGYCSGCKCELSPAIDGDGATECVKCQPRWGT